MASFSYAVCCAQYHVAQLYLKTKGLSLHKIVAKLRALKVFLLEERCHLAHDGIKRRLANVNSIKLGIAVERRVRTARRMPGEQTKDSRLSLQEENKRAMLECIDCFGTELNMK